MLFNSIHFVCFLPIVFMLYWSLKHQWRWALLLLSSYYFYFSYNPWYCLLLLGTTCVDYYAAKKIDSSNEPKTKKKWLLLSIFSNIGVLIAFKYSIFFLNTVLFATNNITHSNYELFKAFIIPAGLSFYTFQSLSYTIDVYRGKYRPTDSLGYFALYVSFFPHMVAGPVVRYNTLMPQFYQKHFLSKIDFGYAARMISWGFFKKLVIADRLGEIVSPVYNNVAAFSGATHLVVGFLFVVQVYCDLSGYSDIASGTAKLFGIDFSINWRRPLLSKSLIEFWQRNHISITTWFRDYLYIGLGGNRCSKKRWLLNIFLVFLISGLWHGANWTFVIWGSMHGIFYLIELLNKEKVKPIKTIPIVGWLYLMGFHTISLIAFRALNADDLLSIYEKIIFDFNFSKIISDIHSISDYFPILLSAILIVFLFLKEINEEFALINKIKGYETIVKPAFYILLILSIFVLGNFNANEFIYFQF